jgi:hypothetical protein
MHYMSALVACGELSPQMFEFRHAHFMPTDTKHQALTRFELNTSGPDPNLKLYDLSRGDFLLARMLVMRKIVLGNARIDNPMTRS